jgi:hypothetical protein
MENVLQTIQKFAVDFYAGAQNIVSAAEPWQILVVGDALLLVVIFLAIGLRIANRSGEVANDALAENAQKLQLAEDKASKVEDQIVKAEEDKRAALAALEREKDRQITENQNQLALAKTRVDQLERMQVDETAFLTGARLEAARIVRDAKDYAYTVSSRADAEYIEIMRHANEEAENLRALSQQRLDQAHETLKKALGRATEIISEARADAARANRAWYEAPPGRLVEPESASVRESAALTQESSAFTQESAALTQESSAPVHDARESEA